MLKKLRPKGAKLSERTFREIVRCFSLDFTAQDTADVLRLHRHTVNQYFRSFRNRILEACGIVETRSGECEVDESYFGPRRVRGKRGRGAGKKTIVFGILKRQGLVHTWIVPNCKVPTIVPIIDDAVSKGSTVYSDDLGAYRALFLRYEHKVVFHGRNQFADGQNHINGIESFWAYVKHRIRKFKGIRKDDFFPYLKESEWRFNHRHDDVEKELLGLLKG